MAQVVWTPVAERELEDILFYIRVTDGRPQTARRIAEALCFELEDLVSQPSAGLRHAEAPDDWQYVKFKRWLIFYRVIPDGIEVMRVVDAVRDLPALLR
jgi:toxin ParE1/3/4